MSKTKPLASSLQGKWNDLGTDRRRKGRNGGKVEERKARGRERHQKDLGGAGDAKFHRLPNSVTARCGGLPTQSLWPERTHFFFGRRRTAEGKYAKKPEAKEALGNKKPSEERKLRIRL